MNLSHTHLIGRRALTALALTLLPLTLPASAQDKPAESPCSAAQHSPTDTKTFFLTNISQQSDADQVMIGIRNMLCPSDRIYLMPSSNAIIVQAPPDQLELAQKLITELDRPTKSYRLTYTLTELDGSKTVGTQHFSMVVAKGQRTSMKEGSKIPVATGSYSNGDATTSASAGIQTQFTYLDIGMNFDSTIDEIANGVRLKSKIEQSSLGQPSTIAGVQEPVVRQTVLEGTSFLTLGKPLMLGSVDVPNSTRHFDIAVVLDEVK